MKYRDLVLYVAFSWLITSCVKEKNDSGLYFTDYKIHEYLDSTMTRLSNGKSIIEIASDSFKVYNFSGDFAYTNNYFSSKISSIDNSTTKYKVECSEDECEYTELVEITSDSIIYIIDYPVPTKFVSKPLLNFYQANNIDKLKVILENSQSIFTYNNYEYSLLRNGNAIFIDSFELVGNEGIWILETFDSELFINIPGFDGIFLQVVSISDELIECQVYGETRTRIKIYPLSINKVSNRLRGEWVLVSKPLCPVPMLDYKVLEEYELYEKLTINNDQLIIHQHFKKDSLNFVMTRDGKYLVVDKRDRHSKRSRIIEIIESDSEKLILKFYRPDLTNDYKSRLLNNQYVRDQKHFETRYDLQELDFLINSNSKFTTSGVLDTSGNDYVKFEVKGFYGFYNVIGNEDLDFKKLAEVDIFQKGNVNQWKYGDYSEIIGYKIYDESLTSYNGTKVNMSVKELKKRLLNFSFLEDAIYTVSKDGRLYIYEINELRKVRSIRMIKKESLCSFLNNI